MSFYRGMVCENVTIKGDKGTPITAYVAKPSGPGPFPGVVHVGASLASGDGNPDSPYFGNWQFQIAVTNCTGSPLTNVKVQGGTNGWAPLTGVPVPSTGSATVSYKNKAQVITWTVKKNIVTPPR